MTGRGRMSAFQSTPPRGRRVGLGARLCVPGSFNPRLRAGGELSASGNRVSFSSFNPRLRAGGESARGDSGIISTGFQSTPPRGRRDRPMTPEHPAKSFNPRLRAGGERKACRHSGSPGRFNPRLRAGGEVAHTAESSEVDMFQSTPPRGRRVAADSRVEVRQLVSIHASAREARQARGRTLVARGCFNPRLRAGGEPLPAPGGAGCPLFQSTPPRGRRAGPEPWRSAELGFQSTPPRGRRAT